MNRGFSLVMAPLMAGALLLGGCGSGENRTAVSGSVRFQNQPLPDGKILFRPANNGPGPVAAGIIKNGQYHIPSDRGPVPGDHDVVLTVTPGGAAPRKPPPGRAAPPAWKDFQIRRTVTGTGPIDFELPPSS